MLFRSVRVCSGGSKSVRDTVPGVFNSLLAGRFGCLELGIVGFGGRVGRSWCLCCRDLGIRVSGYGCIGNWELLSSSNLVMSPLIGGELGSSTSFGLDAAASDV